MTNQNTDDLRCGASTPNGECRNIGTYADGRCSAHTERTTNPLRDTHRDLVEDSDSMPPYIRVARRLKRLIPAVLDVELPDAPRESDTDRDGVFSYAVEVHAFCFGIGFGFWLAVDFVQAANVLVALIGTIFATTEVRKASKRFPTYLTEQAAQEWHYFNGGLAISFVVFKAVLLLNAGGIETSIPDWLGLGAL